MLGNRLAVAAAVVAVSLLSGCAPFADDDLRALVEEVAPAGSSLDCEWGKSTFEGEPDAWYGCWDYRRGSLRKVGNAAEQGLTASGFAVVRRQAPHMIQLTATRGADVVCIDLLEAGFYRGRNTASWEVSNPPGELFIDIWSTKPRETAARCEELPAWADE
jgi:hypothetical protein